MGSYAVLQCYVHLRAHVFTQACVGFVCLHVGCSDCTTRAGERGLHRAQEEPLQRLTKLTKLSAECISP